jgi:hypothetical protein
MAPRFLFLVEERTNHVCALLMPRLTVYTGHLRIRGPAGQYNAATIFRLLDG